MIENELLFLGLLMERPKHGYEIKRQIIDDLQSLMGLEIKSIYYPLKKMEQIGLIKKNLARQDNRPEKIIYSITAKGKKRFESLMAKNFMSVERPFFHMNLSLYFISYVDREKSRKQLKTRIVLLRKVCRHLEGVLKKVKSNSSHLSKIIQHDLDLCLAEIESISRLMVSL